MPHKNIKKYKEYQKIYRIKNKDKISAQQKKWRSENREKIKKYYKEYYLKHRILSNKVLLTEEEKKEKRKIYWQKWYLKNKDKKILANKKWIKNNKQKRRNSQNKYQKTRRQNDYKFKLEQNIGNFIKLSIKEKRKGMRWEKIVGFTLDELIKHLEKQFTPKMNWDNYGLYWHIDHKKPRSWFKYNNINDIEFKKCWSLSNLQPLKANENFKKGNRYES